MRHVCRYCSRLELDCWRYPLREFMDLGMVLFFFLDGHLEARESRYNDHEDTNDHQMESSKSEIEPGLDG